MDDLESSMRFLCDETRMLTGITIAYGTRTESQWVQYGRAQEIARTADGFVPCVRPLTPDSIYDLASLTKLFTTVLLLQLMVEGRLFADETVGDIDPRFVNLHQVSVMDVLCFRISLQTPGRLDEAYTLEEAMRRLYAVNVCPTPAVRIYSDINAMVIACIVEKRRNMPLAQALEQFICSPIGLADTAPFLPEAKRERCVCYSYEHRIVDKQYIVRDDPPLGAPHDPKALRLSNNGHSLCGHAGLFSTRQDMVRFAQALLSGELLPMDTLRSIGLNRTGKPNGDGTYRQYLGMLCFSKHPNQHLSEVPEWMGKHALGLSGFTGNHLSIDPDKGCFVLFLGNRCHGRVSHIVPPEGITLADYALDAQGVGLVRWTDGRAVPSSARYVYFKDAKLHVPVAARMRSLGWLD